MSCKCGLRECPKCSLHTMPPKTDRCIPCGYNLTDKPVSPKQARANYRATSGKDPCR